MKNIVFFGSSPLSCIVLEKLVTSAGCQVISVVTKEDKPVGRHLKMTPNPVKVMAKKYKIDVQYSMSDIQREDRIGLVAAYGKIIKQEILDKFNGQIYNIHPSLLPKYRGPSPLQQQILDNVSETGVTIIQLDAQMDHGPIVATKSDSVLPNDTWITLGERLFKIGADIILNSKFEIFNQIPKGQNHNEATYTKMLTRQDGFIPYDQLQDANCQMLIAKMKRAYAGWPGVWTIDPSGKRLKLS